MPHPLISTTSFNAWYKGLSLADNDLGQTQQLTEAWIIERKTEGAAGLAGTKVHFAEDDYRLMVVEGAAPYIGQRMVDWYPNAKNWMQFATCVNRQFEYIDNGRCTATYTWLAPFHTSVKWWETDPSSTAAVDIAYDLTVDYQSSFRQTEIFRQKHSLSALTVPDPTWANGLSPADIGGYSILPGRQGLPYNLRQVRIRVRRTVDFKYIPQAQLINVFNAYVNTYNSHPFLDGSVTLPNPAGSGTISVNFAGYPAGTIVFEGFSCVKTDGQYGEVIFELIHEPYWHFYDQVPQADPDGDPKTDQPSTGPWAGTVQLADVRWRRQARETTDHDQIFFDQNSYNGAAWTPTESAGYKKLALAGWWQP